MKKAYVLYIYIHLTHILCSEVTSDNVLAQDAAYTATQGDLRYGYIHISNCLQEMVVTSLGKRLSMDDPTGSRRSLESHLSGKEAIGIQVQILLTSSDFSFNHKFPKLT